MISTYLVLSSLVARAYTYHEGRKVISAKERSDKLSLERVDFIKRNNKNSRIMSYPDYGQYHCIGHCSMACGGCDGCYFCRIKQPLDHKNNISDNTLFPKVTKQEHWDQIFWAS